MRSMRNSLSLALLPLLFLGAGSLSAQAAPPAGGRAEVVLTHADAPRWAIAIHGGAGVIPKTLPEAE